MRDAEDEEETRLFDANQDGQGAAPRGGAPAGTSDPDDEATKLIDTASDEEATRIVDTESDNEPTQLIQAIGSGEWLLSRGTDPPRSVSRAQLFKEIADGTLSPETYAWKDGMKDWQPLRAIPTLAPLLRGRTAPTVPRAVSTPLARKKPELGPLVSKEARAESPQSRITAVSRSSSTARAAAATSHGSSVQDSKSEHTVTSSSARASKAAKDSTVLVSGSVPPSDSVESDEPLLPVPKAPEETPSSKKRHSSAPPRPAAGQPPSPTELIAKPPPVVTVPRPHREVTQPARSRLTAVTQLTQLAASAGRQQNVVLWVLGAAGWVVAGILGGILFAKSNEPPPAPPPVIETRVEPERFAPPVEAAPPPLVEAGDLPTASSPATPPLTKLPQVQPRMVAPSAVGAAPPAPVSTATEAEPATAPAEATATATGDQINSPGF